MAQCAFCETEALAEGYTGPPMCDKHVVVAMAVERMRREWGWTEITPQQVQQYLFFNWVPGFDLAEVPALCVGMPGVETSKVDRGQ